MQANAGYTMKKHRQHYVWQGYLDGWVVSDKLFCLGFCRTENHPASAHPPNA
jgi:hypothetical protein